MTDEVKTTFTGTAQQPIDQINKLTKTVANLEERLRGVTMASRQSERAGNDFGRGTSDYLDRMMIKFFGVRAAIRLVNAELQAGHQRGLDALKEITEAGKIENQFIQSTFGASDEAFNAMKSSIDKLLAGGKLLGTTREQLSQAAAPLTSNKLLSPQQREDMLMTSAELFRGNASAMAQFADAAGIAAKRFKLSSDEAAGLAMRFLKAGVPLSNLAKAEEATAKQLDDQLRKWFPTAEKQIEALQGDVGMRHRAMAEAGDDGAKIIQVLTGRFGDRTGPAVEGRSDRQRVIERTAEQQLKVSARMLDLDLARVRDREFAVPAGESGRTSRAIRSQTTTAMVEDLVEDAYKQARREGGAMNVVGEKFRQNFFDPIERFSSWLTGDPFGRKVIAGIQNQAMGSTSPDDTVTLLQRAAQTLEAMKDRGELDGETANKMMDRNNKLLEQLGAPPSGPAANVNQHVETRKGGS